MENKDNKLSPVGEPESLDTLDGSGTVVESPSETLSSDAQEVSNNEPGVIPLPTPEAKGEASSKPPKKPIFKNLKNRLAGFNIYLGILLLIIVVAVGIVIYGIVHNKSVTPTSSVKGQTLSPAQISELSSGTTVLGTTQQNLTVQSNATFTGSVLVQKDLNVAGDIKLGGSLNLPGINVSGISNIEQIQTNKLIVSGDTTIAGQLSVGKGLSVAGATTFNGAVSANQLTVQNLTINSSLQLTHHIDAGGITPTRSSGSALGNGGTVSVSGSDTAGSITINTGSSAGAGCFVTVTFNQGFNSTPHIVVTPVGSAAAGINYYINRSTTNFSLCTTSSPPSGQSFGFDYLAFD